LWVGKGVGLDKQKQAQKQGKMTPVKKRFVLQVEVDRETGRLSA